MHRRCGCCAWRGSLGAVLLLIVTAVTATAQPRDPGPDATRTEKRIALVIGNAAYAFSPLKNPVNDARAMARSLRERGFEVIERENADQRTMRRAIIEFGDKIRQGGVGLFYFSGHGMQVGGRNYLVPVGAEIKDESEVEVESVDAAAVLARMESARNRLNIVILDACRDNPFGRSFRSASRGLASIDAPSGTLIAYATAPGRVASDGAGANGLYTAELLSAMREPGVRVEDMFKQVRRAVQQKSSGTQVPWESSSLVGDFVFSLRGAATVAPATPQRAVPSLSTEVVREFGSLAIRSKRAGVEVWLGDQKIGETQAGGALVVNNVAVGSHRLQARKADHKDWEREVAVVTNQRTDVVIDVEPRRSRSSLGVFVQPLTPGLSEAFGVAKTAGALVGNVRGGSPAEAAGLRRGDIVLEIAGTPIVTSHSALRAVALSAPGDVVPVKISRGRVERVLSVRIGDAGREYDVPEAHSVAAEAPPRSGDKVYPPATVSWILGLNLSATTPEYVKELASGLPATGVIIQYVKEGSSVDEVRVERGYMIHEINRQPVASVADFERVAKTIRTGEIVVLLLVSRDQTWYVAFRKD